MNEVEHALAQALKQTGFPFEHFAFTTANAHGWGTRSNRLYVDPDEGKPREMDLLCFRSGKGAEASTHTTLLISCKARSGKPWVLLTRPWPERAASWYQYPPVAVWTNHEVLKHEVEKPKWGLEYFNSAHNAGLTSWAADSPREVFALHEFEAVTKQDGRSLHFRALGDSSLYEGNMSLLKALAHETRSLQQRHGTSKDRFICQFNLIQLLDGDLYEAAFESDAVPAVRKVERYRYFARTALDRKEFSARIDYCTRPAFAQLLQELETVHDFNCGHFNGQVRNFFETALTTPDRTEFLGHELARQIAFYVSVFGSIERPNGTEWVRLERSEAGLKVTLDIGAEAVARLEKDKYFTHHLQRIVQEVCRYSGPIELGHDDIPF